jgi:DNA invertase Pin-like site-specific DNA recombinase
MCQGHEQRNPSVVPRPRLRVAQYIRMSTEHQQYSTNHQKDVIGKYVKTRGQKVVQTYMNDSAGVNESEVARP